MFAVFAAQSLGGTVREVVFDQAAGGECAYVSMRERESVCVCVCVCMCVCVCASVC